MFKIFKNFSYYFSKRYLSSLQSDKKLVRVDLNKISLTGRDLIRPTSLTVDEIKSLIWTALELKAEEKQHGVKDICLNKARIGLVLQEPSVIQQSSVQSAAKLFNLNVNTVILPNEHLGSDYKEIGYMLNSISDLIFCFIDKQDAIEKICDAATCPVVGIKSSHFSVIEAITSLMTMQETFNYLRCLKFCWVGMNCPLLATYMCLLPRFCLDFNYVCIDSAANPIKPCLLETGAKISQEKETELHSFTDPAEAIKRMQVTYVSLR